MNKSLITLVLIAACAGCAHHRSAPVQTVGFAPNLRDVHVMQDPSGTSASLEAALPQFSRGAPPTMLKSLRPAYSAAQAFPDVQRIAGRPVVAITEYKDWYWYATDVAPATDANGPGSFLSGYAVQKGGFLAWKF